MRERFSTEDWNAVRMLPFVVFARVAYADGAIQREEATRFTEELKSSAFCKDELRRELSQDILASDFMDMFTQAMDRETWDGRIDAATTALRRSLPDAGYRKFVGDLILFAIGVAIAAGGEEGESLKTPEEEAELIALARQLGADIDDLRASLSEPGC
ncbi:MAG: hypothetical protein ACYTG6_02770 [Planctomycetota bacterium]|jgi:hypothetical protein